jgi:hypothetical protein
MMEIIIMNLVFWNVYVYVCMIPQMMMQKLIDSA